MPSLVEALEALVFLSLRLSLGTAGSHGKLKPGVADLLGPLSVQTVEPKDYIGQGSLSCKKQKPVSWFLKPKGSLLAPRVGSPRGWAQSCPSTALPSPASAGFIKASCPTKGAPAQLGTWGQHSELSAAQEGRLPASPCS